jgi:hypothetical protein
MSVKESERQSMTASQMTQSRNADHRRINDVIYAQIKSGKRMHLAYEPGEGKDDSSIVRAGRLSLPLCGRRFTGTYRMTCNLPLANLCRACNRVYGARYRAIEGATS